MTDLSAEFKALATYRPTNKVRFVTAASLSDELDTVAQGAGFEALYQFTGQQGADLSERLVLARTRR